MKVLIAEDDLIPRRMLEVALVGWGFQVVSEENGRETLKTLQRPDAPKLAILDWMMPELDGPEICQQIRQQDSAQPPYIIMLTVKGAKSDVVTGLQAGANDYLAKPFDVNELHARIMVGKRVVELQANLAARVRELEGALTQVKQLRKLLPICCYCKKIRDDQDYWQQVESYLLDHSEVRFSHDICPTCLKREMSSIHCLHATTRGS